MSISKVIFGDQTLVDLTSDTVCSEALLAGYTAHGSDGSLVEGALGAPTETPELVPGGTASVTLYVIAIDDDFRENLSEFISSSTFKLHCFHGTHTLDAQSEGSLDFSLLIPSDAVHGIWHYTVTADDGAVKYILAAGDWLCGDGIGKPPAIEGTLSTERFVKVYTTTTSDGGYYKRWYAIESDTMTQIIGSWSPYGFNTNLLSVSLPNCLFIGKDNGTGSAGDVFYNCSALTSVELPAATTLGDSVFYNCSALTSVELPAATTLGNYVFSNCSALTSVELPAATTLGDSVFQGCPNLRLIVLSGDEMCEAQYLHWSTLPCFSSQRPVGRIYVNDALVDQYKAADAWKSYASYIYPYSEWDGTVPELPKVSAATTLELDETDYEVVVPQNGNYEEDSSDS